MYVADVCGEMRVSNNELEHYCMNCQHYLTEHIPEEDMEYASDNHIPVNDYIGRCEKLVFDKDGTGHLCSCQEFELFEDDQAPSVRDTAKAIKKEKKLLRKLGIASGKASVSNIRRKLNRNNNSRDRQSEDEVLANLKEMESRGEVYYDEEKGWRLTPAHLAKLREQREELE